MINLDCQLDRTQNQHGNAYTSLYPMIVIQKVSSEEGNHVLNLDSIILGFKIQDEQKGEMVLRIRIHLTLALSCSTFTFYPMYLTVPLHCDPNYTFCSSNTLAFEQSLKYKMIIELLNNQYIVTANIFVCIIIKKLCLIKLHCMYIILYSTTERINIKM